MRPVGGQQDEMACDAIGYLRRIQCQRAAAARNTINAPSPPPLGLGGDDPPEPPEEEADCAFAARLDAASSSAAAGAVMEILPARSKNARRGSSDTGEMSISGSPIFSIPSAGMATCSTIWNDVRSSNCVHKNITHRI